MASRVAIGAQAAGGQQQDPAELQSEPRRGQRARDLAHGDSEQKQEPEGEHTPGARSGERAKADRHGEQEQEERMNADLNSKETADGEAPSAHGSIVFARRFAARQTECSRPARIAGLNGWDAGYSPGLFAHAN